MSLLDRVWCPLVCFSPALLWIAFLGVAAADSGTLGAEGSTTSVTKESPVGERIKAFCIDFNWGSEGFAPPGMYASASAKEHVEWYRQLGVNTIQTFCVSCPGYAWYRSEVAPVQPGMKGDFLNEITALGHV